MGLQQAASRPRARLLYRMELLLTSPSHVGLLGNTCLHSKVLRMLPDVACLARTHWLSRAQLTPPVPENVLLQTVRCTARLRMMKRLPSRCSRLNGTLVQEPEEAGLWTLTRCLQTCYSWRPT